MQRKKQWQLSEGVVDYFAKNVFLQNLKKQAVQDYVSSVTTKIENTWQLSYQPEIEAQVFVLFQQTYLSILDKCLFQASYLLAEIRM